jgi:hypothetical protein
MHDSFMKKYKKVTIEDRRAIYGDDKEKIIKIYTTYSDFMDNMKN